MFNAEELAQAKVRLYHLLLAKGASLWTHEELMVGHALVLDKDIQTVLDQPELPRPTGLIEGESYTLAEIMERM